MPCIQMSTNQNVSNEKKEVLKTRFGQAIELIPGKSEKWLMCVFHPTWEMWFQGRQERLAFLEVGIYGQPKEDSLNRLTEELMEIISSELAIAKEHIYIKYAMTPCWGWNGKNF